MQEFRPPEPRTLDDKIYFEWLGETVPRTDEQSLVESLQPKDITPEALCSTAAQLLDKHGQPTTVNGEPAIVTEQYYKLKADLGGYYVRLGRKSVEGTPEPPQPAFIFSTMADIRDIETPNGEFSELFFEGRGAGTQLVNGPDAPNTNHYRINSPVHLKIANEIIRDIRQQYRSDESQPITPVAEAPDISRGIEDPVQEPWYEDARWQHMQDRRFRLGVAAVIATAATAAGLALTSGGNSATDNTTHVSAKKPVSTNQICNPDGVCAVGPDTPLKTIPLAPAAVINRLPVDVDYKQAMTKISVKGQETLNPDHILQTDAGTYRYAYPAETTHLPSDGDCTYIEGNFNQGISAAFTTNAKLARLISLKVLDTSTIEVCRVSGAPAHAAGSFYIARSTP